MGRKVARESAMKIIFQMEVNNDFSLDTIDVYFDNNETTEDEKKYIREAVKTIIDNIEVIDKSIEKYSQGWKINRMPKVDLAIVRVAVYEILYREDIPIQVSINEALEISKKYSSEESSKFINGLLGGFVRELN